MVPEAKPQASESSASSGVVRKKYEMCKNFKEKGTCKYGDRCLFAHGSHEMTKRGSENEVEPPPVVIEKKEEKEAEDTEITAETTKMTLGDEKNELVVASEQSCSAESGTGTVEDEIQDHGENSTTLSSIEHSNANTPEINTTTKNTQYQNNFENFKKEEEFKELLDNLEIENIEIVLSARPNTKNDEAEQKFNIEIEKLLSEDDEDLSAP